MGKQWLWGSVLGLVIVLPGTVAWGQAKPTDAYTEAMNIGYAASNQFDYQTALVNFQRALAARPDDVYALNAIANMEHYIERNRLAPISARITELQDRLALAADTKDWVCVTATIDDLIPYTEGLERERLTGYRSQLTGVLESRTDIEFWSTVCSPDRPVL